MNKQINERIAELKEEIEDIRNQEPSEYWSEWEKQKDLNARLQELADIYAEISLKTLLSL